MEEKKNPTAEQSETVEKKPASTATKSTAAKKPASTATKSTAAKKPASTATKSTATKKPASTATKSTAAKKPASTATKSTAAKKPASTATKSTATKKPASTATKSTATMKPASTATKSTAAKKPASTATKSTAAKKPVEEVPVQEPVVTEIPAEAPIEKPVVPEVVAEMPIEEPAVEAAVPVVQAPIEEPVQQPATEEASAVSPQASAKEDIFAEDTPLDKNIKLMSPGRMVARRFFRSKLSIIGLVLIVGLILFSWLGPVVLKWGGYKWEEQTIDETPFIDYTYEEIQVTVDGETMTIYQVVETERKLNTLAYPGGDHVLGTDKSGMDVFVRLMYGGRVSLSVSVLTVFLIAIIGIVMGGISGYFGGAIDNVIMRICDIIMCIPTLPILLIVGALLDAYDVDAGARIYYLMIFLTLISWAGSARLVRGQILFLREQEYMIAAEAMGYSTARKIFKHLVPNVLPQLIVSMTLSLGSMILYEASLSYLGMGVKAPNASWGGMINIVTEDSAVLKNYFNVWGPPGICIILAVLGFNFIGDGLRDALDPKMRR